MGITDYLEGLKSEKIFVGTDGMDTFLDRRYEDSRLKSFPELRSDIVVHPEGDPYEHIREALKPSKYNQYHDPNKIYMVLGKTKDGIIKVTRSIILDYSHMKKECRDSPGVKKVVGMLISEVTKALESREALEAMKGLKANDAYNLFTKSLEVLMEQSPLYVDKNIYSTFQNLIKQHEHLPDISARIQAKYHRKN